MEQELTRLAAVLHQTAHDAGCALLVRADPEITRFCVAQYNRIHARLTELDPELVAPFGTLPADAPAGEVRILARALAAYLDEKVRAARKRTHMQGFCLDLCWPSRFLKFDFC